MIIIDEKMLTNFRGPGMCQFCGRYCHKDREASHLFARGMGSGSRLDIEINLMALGGPWECKCHHLSHSEGKPSRADLLNKKSKYVGAPAHSIEEAIKFLQRLDVKRTKIKGFVDWGLIGPAAKALCVEVLTGRLEGVEL